jgi:hypothetical protein
MPHNLDTGLRQAGGAKIMSGAGGHTPHAAGTQGRIKDQFFFSNIQLPLSTP